MMSTWNRSLMSKRRSLLLRLPYWTPKLDETLINEQTIIILVVRVETRFLGCWFIKVSLTCDSIYQQHSIFKILNFCLKAKNYSTIL